MDKRARLGLGYLAQEPSIFIDLSVEDNLKLVLEFSNLDSNQQHNGQALYTTMLNCQNAARNRKHEFFIWSSARDILTIFNNF